MIISCLGTTISRALFITRGFPARFLFRSLRRYYLAVPALLIILSGTFSHAEDVSKDQRQWWINQYGLLDVRSEPLAARAERIFARVAAAADKKGNWPPKLVLVDGKAEALAGAIKDGSIILSHVTLKICYRDVSPEIGDSRLAFLIGHELAHLAKDDFWHSDAFAAVASSENDAQVRRILTLQLEKTGDSLDFVKTQELQADSYGILYMTMAGYDPNAIIDPDTTDFFQYWTTQIAGKPTLDDEIHVLPAARAEFIRTEMQTVINALPRFTLGKKLYQSGDYESAVTAFESFLEKYAGREVYNDLGLSHYQLALQSLSACRIPLPGFPVAYDSETTAQRLRQGTSGGKALHVPGAVRQIDKQEIDRLFAVVEAGETASCLLRESHEVDLRQAVQYLEAAANKDADYLPARINLSTALILSGDYAKAASVADEALKIESDNPAALYNKAAAERLFNKKTLPENVDSSEPAPSIAALQQRAGYPENLGMGFFADIGNFSAGPSMMWWPAEHFGIQASYGQGTFTTYSFRGLLRYGSIAGLIPYAGLGYLSVERESSVNGVDARFSDQGGELLAGAIWKISNRLSLTAAGTVNTIRLRKTETIQGRAVHMSMTYNSLSSTAAFVYLFE
jgi:hypothetical protein